MRWWFCKCCAVLQCEVAGSAMTGLESRPFLYLLPEILKSQCSTRWSKSGRSSPADSHVLRSVRRRFEINLESNSLKKLISQKKNLNLTLRYMLSMSMCACVCVNVCMCGCVQVCACVCAHAHVCACAVSHCTLEVEDKLCKLLHSLQPDPNFVMCS